MSEDTIDDFEPIVILSDAEWEALDRPVPRTVAWCSPCRPSRRGRHSDIIRPNAVPTATQQRIRRHSPPPSCHRRLVMPGCARRADLYPFGFDFRFFLAAA